MSDTENDERISGLFLQLSSADRRRIVTELLKGSLKMHEVAKRLDITATEAFRQLQRMTEAGLLEKVPDGKYRPTPYAQLILESTSTMAFLSRHREYFMDHDTSMMPREFRTRLGELSRTTLMTEAVLNLNRAIGVLKDAEKRIDLMVEQRLVQHAQVVMDQIHKGVKVRFLLQEGMLEGAREELRSVKHLVEIRTVAKICALILMTDKQVDIALRKFDGRMDYAIFAGEDPVAMKWAGDLFEDQWKKARQWHP